MVHLARLPRLQLFWPITQDWLDFAAGYPGKMYIIGDEPNNPNNPNRVTPAVYAERYDAWVRAICAVDPAAQFATADFLIAPWVPDPGGWLGYPPATYRYVREFYQIYEALAGAQFYSPIVDEWRFAIGPRPHTDVLADWAGRINEAAGQTHPDMAQLPRRPVAFGNFNTGCAWGGACGNPENPEVNKWLMRMMMRHLRNTPNVVQGGWWSYDWDPVDPDAPVEVTQLIKRGNLTYWYWTYLEECQALC